MVVVALALVVSGFALVAPAAVASSPINVGYGQPTDYYELGEYGEQTIAFAGEQGDSIVIEHFPNTYRGQQLVLRTPGGAEIEWVFTQYYGAFGPYSLPASGTYSLTVTTWDATWSQTTIHKADVHEGTQELDGKPHKFHLGMGDTASLTFNGTAGQRVSLFADESDEAEQYVSSHYGAFQLYAPGGALVWDGSTREYGESTFIDAFELATTGQYRVDFHPNATDGGGALVVQTRTVPPTPAVPLTEGDWASSRIPVQGADVKFTFQGTEGQSVSLQDVAAPWDAEILVEGPSSTVSITDQAADGVDLVLAEDGQYAVHVDGHREMGGTGLRLLELDQPTVASLPLEGTPAVLPVDGRKRLKFDLADGRTEPFVFAFATGNEATGRLRVMEPGNADPLESVTLVEGEQFTSSDFASAASGDYWVEFAPSADAEGAVAAWTQAPTAPIEPVLLEPNAGSVDIDTEWAEGVSPPLDTDTTYRLKVATDADLPSGAQLWGYAPNGEWLWLDLPDGNGSTEFTTPTTFEPDDDKLTWTVSAPGVRTSKPVTIELHTGVGKPAINQPTTPELPDDTHVSWTVDAIDDTVDGYAVAVDSLPSTDPGNTVTQTTDGLVGGLTPGTHWVHVRGIKGTVSGPVAHAKVVVADSTGVTPAPPEVSAVTGGAVSSAPALTAHIPVSEAGVDEVRFTVTDESGQQAWDTVVPVVNGQAQAPTPDSVHASPGRYRAKAQFVYSSGAMSARSEAAEYLFDPLAPVVPAPTCDGQCLPTNTVLFQGDLAPGVGEQVDLGSLVTVEGNWVASLDVSLTSDAPADDADLKFEPGLPNPDLVDPTLTLAPDEVQTARITPNEFNSFTVTNVGATIASVTITATGWTPGLDDKELREDAVIEEGIDRHEALDTPLEVGSEPVEVPAEITVEPCVPDAPCARLVDEPASAEGASTQQPELTSDELGSASAASSTEPEVSDGDSQPQLRGSGSSDLRSKSAASSSCSTRGWTVLSRSIACHRTIMEVEWVDFDIKPPDIDIETLTVAVDHVVTAQWNSLDVTHEARFTTLEVHGDDDEPSKTGTVDYECDDDNCDVVSDDDNSTFSLGSPSDWREGRWRAPVDVGDSMLFSSSLEDFTARITVMVNSRDANVVNLRLPDVRCDSGENSFYGRDPRTKNQKPGCILRGAAAPTWYLPSRQYPAHAQLVEEGQEEVGTHPGRADDGIALSPAQWSQRPINRAEARKLCALQLPNRKGDCDEYPYAGTEQGCYNPYVRALLRCRVADVPRSQNRGAGSKYGWFIRKQRLMIGEPFYIHPVWESGPVEVQ
jgi:hypothetical protein